MPLLAAALLFVLTPAQIAAFDEAFARAQTYESDTASMSYRLETLYPMLGPIMARTAGDCRTEAGGKPIPEFKIVLSFRGGAFEGLHTNSHHPVAVCIWKGLGGVKSWPAPPHPDFAEEMTFVFEPPTTVAASAAPSPAG